MTSSKKVVSAREMADIIFDAGCDQKEIAKALDEMGEQKDIFLSHLALRKAIMHSERMDSNTKEEFAQISLIDDIKSSFHKMMTDTSDQVAPSSLSSPSVWLKAQDALGGDIGFVMKLADGHLRPPRMARGMRYLADALGVTLDQVRSHFREGQVHGTLVDEFSSKVKPTSHVTEDFEDAVQEAVIPDAIRRQLIGE